MHVNYTPCSTGRIINFVSARCLGQQKERLPAPAQHNLIFDARRRWKGGKMELKFKFQLLRKREKRAPPRGKWEKFKYSHTQWTFRNLPLGVWCGTAPSRSHRATATPTGHLNYSFIQINSIMRITYAFVKRSRRHLDQSIGNTLGKIVDIIKYKSLSLK